MSKNKKPTQADVDESAQKKREILEAYVSLVQQGVLFPGRSDLKSLGISRDMMRYYFGNLARLRTEAKVAYPEVFSGGIDIDEYLSDKNLARLNRTIKKHKRFIITTAVSGQVVHKGFIQSMRTFAQAQKAKILILPSHDPAHNLDNEIDWYFDKMIVNEDFVFEETPLNSNFFISGIRVTAKQINPITGLNEISQTKGSFISASPKQFLEYDSVSANKLPHARMTSGACTKPNYATSRGNSLRTGYLAEHQHTIGAVIVEIVDNNIYHFRQVQAAEDGSFCDLGFEYGPKGAKKLSGKDAPVLVMGDYHAGEHDDSAVNAWIEVIDQLGVQEVVFHDMFNGASVNPHEENDIILKSERAEKGLNSLRKELALTANEFDRILGRKSVKKGVVVKSNHDDMLDRWLKKGAFAKDPVNFKIGVDLASALTGTAKDYFKSALELVHPPKHMAKIQWLTVDEDYVVGGIHLGAHGDKSANGARGSIKGLAKSYPKCVIGHSHTPGIFKGAFQVGTTSLLRLGYNKGPSSWVHCSCLVYRNGQRQLINSINGAWKLNG